MLCFTFHFGGFRKCEIRSEYKRNVGPLPGGVVAVLLEVCVPHYYTGEWVFYVEVSRSKVQWLIC